MEHILSQNDSRRYKQGSILNAVESRLRASERGNEGAEPPTAAEGPAKPGLGLSTLETSPNLVFTRDPLKKRLRRMKRCIRAAASAINQAHLFADRRQKPAFITLTYAEIDTWQPKHISRLMDHYRAWLSRRGYRLHAVWVAELQKRGAVHYHIVMWLPRGLTPPKPDKQGWWPHGSTNTKWAYKPVGYLMKYASKGVNPGKSFPRGCRLFGIYNAPIFLGWWRCPRWMSELTKPGEKIVQKHGFWVDYKSGYGYRTPWVVNRIGPKDIEISWKGWGEFDILPINEIEAMADINSALWRYYRGKRSSD